MDINGIIMIVVAILSVLFGYGFGWFEWGRKLKETQRMLEEKKAQELPKAKEEPLTTPPPGPLPPLPHEEPALLVLREVNGRLRLNLEGTVLEAETISTIQRKSLIDVITRIRPWIEGRAAPVAVPAPTPAPATTIPLTAPVAAASPTRPVAVAAKKEEVLAPLSMVAQIDEILQQSLLGTPLEKMGVKLVEIPGGGVTVTVGLNHYAGVGEVPNPEVQAAIRAAIAVWEKKFTPG
jgi:hypothetical protein